MTLRWTSNKRRPKSWKCLISRIRILNEWTPEKAVDAMPKRTMETTSIAGPGKARHLSCHRADSVPLACPIHILQQNHRLPTIEGRMGQGGSFFFIRLGKEID